MFGLGYHVFNDTRKKTAVLMNGVEMPPFYGGWFRPGGRDENKGGYDYTPHSSHLNVSESDVYKLRMCKKMKRLEANSTHGPLRIISRKFKPLRGRNQNPGGRPLHLRAKLTRSDGKFAFSRLIDPAFSSAHLSSDEMIASVPREEETSPGRLVLVFKKMTKTEIEEEKTQTKKPAPKRKKFWAWTGSKNVLGGRSEHDLKEAFLADERTDHSQPHGRFYFVWGKKENAEKYGEISVALRPGVGISVECVPPIEANDIIPAKVPVSRFGRQKRRTNFFNPAAHAMEEARATGAKIESISARLNGGLFRVTALMTEEQLRQCEADELIDKFNRVLKVGRYRKLKWVMPKKK